MTPIRIIVFAKAPQPGRVKTRLIPALGPLGAARLAREMLDRTLEAAVQANTGPVTLCTDPKPHTLHWRHVALPAGLETSWQGDGDLGARMGRAARAAIGAGEKVILSGTDCAEINASLFRDAARHLGKADAALYPSTDGGYVLLALRRYDPTLFTGIAWSTAEVAATTIHRINALGWHLHMGPVLHDIDTPADLTQWKAP